MTTRRRRGEDGISFEHRGPCTDAERHRHCSGLWRRDHPRVHRRRETRPPQGQRQDQGRRRGQAPRPAPPARQGRHPKAGYAHYTVRQAAEDWLASGLDAAPPKRSRRTRTSSSTPQKPMGPAN